MVEYNLEKFPRLNYYDAMLYLDMHDGWRLPTLAEIPHMPRPPLKDGYGKALLGYCWVSDIDTIVNTDDNNCFVGNIFKNRMLVNKNEKFLLLMVKDYEN